MSRRGPISEFNIPPTLRSRAPSSCSGWAYYRKRWESLLKNACWQNEVFFWADRDERTLMTARALASGLAGVDCTPTISETYEPIDPLFHPTTEFKGEGCNFTLPDPPPPSAKQVQAVQEVVDCCQKKFCEEAFNKETCELKDVVASEKAKDAKDARDFTQSFGEMLLLQHAEGFKVKPADPVEIDPSRHFRLAYAVPHKQFVGRGVVVEYAPQRRR
jgi:Histidine phosphatase superfamily (branch 2)